MKNKEKYDIRHLTFNVSQYQNGIIKDIDICHNLKRINKIIFLGETSITQAMNAIGEWLEEEYVPDILTDKEKDYLSAVIKPFRDEVMRIKKINHAFLNDKQFLRIELANECFTFPFFEKGAMYKSMKVGKAYTLEELGL